MDGGSGSKISLLAWVVVPKASLEECPPWRLSLGVAVSRHGSLQTLW